MCYSSFVGETPPLPVGIDYGVRNTSYSLLQRVKSRAREVFAELDQAADRVAAVLSHRIRVFSAGAALTVRHGLQLYNRATGVLPRTSTVLKVIGALKLLNWLGAVSSILSLRNITKNALEDIWLGDVAGVVHDVAMGGLETVDLVDGVATGWSGFVAFGVLESVPFFDLIGLPIAVVLNVAGGANRVLSVAQGRTFSERMTKMQEQVFGRVTEENYTEVRAGLMKYLESEVGVSEEDLKALHATAQKGSGTAEQKEERLQMEIKKFLRRKFKTVRRHADGEIAEQLQKLYLLLSEADLDADKVEKIRETFDAAQEMISRKIGVKVTGVVGNVIMLTALFLLAGGISSLAGLVLFGVAAILRLTLAVYDNCFKHRGVTYPELELAFGIASHKIKAVSADLLTQQMTRIRRIALAA